MPSTLVHMALAGILGAALLGVHYDARSLAVVAGLSALPDADAFVGLVSTAGHRTVGHTFLIPIVLGLLLWVDLRVREESFVRDRWGAWGVQTAWVSVFALAVAGIGLDFVTGGVNPLWPLHDQLYVVRGKMVLSNQRGLVQTFVDLSPEQGSPGPQSMGSSEEVHVSTGVDPKEGKEPKNVERVFPIARAGWHLGLLVAGPAVCWARFKVGLGADGSGPE